MDSEGCYQCPRRSLTCHNVETCEYWAKHEEKKKKRYNNKREYTESMATHRIEDILRNKERFT